MSSPTATTGNFVSPAWLAQHLSDPALAIVDGSWYLPAERREPHAEYRDGHIPGAVFFDIDHIADTGSGLPHMLPSPQRFAAAVGNLGIGDGVRIVVYDGSGLFTAPRVWWTLRIFGATDVKILAGGLPRWKAEGRPLEQGTVTREPRTFTPDFNAAAVAGAVGVSATIANGSAQIVDARSGARFRGEAPEPRPGVRSGHIPKSRNVYYGDLIENGALRSPDEVLAAFERAGVDPRRPIITTCGSGVTAAILAVALQEAGMPAPALYDGSWSEWGARRDLPVATGPADPE